MLRSEVLADHYRAKALEAAQLAGEARLVQVRHKYEMAAAKWRELADNEDVRSTRANDRIARLPPEKLRGPALGRLEGAPCIA